MDDKERLMLIGEQTLLSEERQLLLAHKNALVAKLMELDVRINEIKKLTGR